MTFASEVNTAEDDKGVMPLNVYPFRDTVKPDHLEPTTGGWKEGCPIVLDIGRYQWKLHF